MAWECHLDNCHWKDGANVVQGTMQFYGNPMKLAGITTLQVTEAEGTLFRGEEIE